MDNPDCSLSCLMKLDLQNTINKIDMLQDNWPSFFDKDSIDKLSQSELRCSLCLLEVVIKAIINEEYSCSNRKIIQLVMLRTYMENTFALHELEQMKDELEEEYP